MPMTPERMAEIIFDPKPFEPDTTPDTGILKKLFGKKADTRIEQGRYRSLNQAAARLQKEGLPKDLAQKVTQGVQNMMADILPEFIALMAFEGEKSYLLINDIDWSLDHYLGVKIKDPAIDLTTHEKFIPNLRADFVKHMIEYINDGQKQNPGITPPHA